MKYRQFYIGKLPKKQWREVFTYCLSISNRFKVHVYKKSSEFEKSFLEKLNSNKNLDTRTWCKHYNEVSGRLDHETRMVFRNYLKQSLTETGEELWDFQFLDDFRVVLYVGDYTDRIVIFSEAELERLNKFDVGFNAWDEHQVCQQMLDERKAEFEEDLDNDLSLDIDIINKAVESFFNCMENGVDK